jgi:magnesium transporter
MASARRRDPRSERGRAGVWELLDGRPRDRGGAGTAPQQERIRILTRPASAAGQISQISPGELAKSIQDERLLVWIDILHPREEAAAILKDGVGLLPLTLEDVMAPLRMPKVDVLGDAQAFVAAFGLRLEEDDEPRLRAVEVDVLVGPGWLVTVRHGPVPELEARLDAQLRSDAALTGHAGAALAHAGLDAIIDGHLPIMLRTADLADRLEDLLDPRSRQSSLAALESLIVLRRDLLAFRRLAVAQQEVLRRLQRLDPDLGAYFSDVGDNEREAIDMADATRDYIDGAIEAFRMRRDERTESGIRRLTVLAAVLGPLSLLTGLYGVNFREIPGTENPWGFYIFVAVELALAALAIWLLRRRGLL